MTETPEVMNAIREILKLEPQIKEHRRQLREIEKAQSVHREYLKSQYGDNTIIHTNVGNITIKERVQDGKLSLEDIRDMFDTIHWLGTDIKDRLMTGIENICETKRKYSKTLTVKKIRKKRKTLKHKDSLKQEE